MSLEKVIGYTFSDSEILTRALTHTSYTNEKKLNYNNERLEFLGDSVLSLVVSKHLYSNYKNLPEGELTRIRATLVCEKSLFSFAQKIQLGEYIRLGKGEEITGGRSRPSIVSDAFEALIAAVYLDGGMEQAEKFILSFIDEVMKSQGKGDFSDYKTVLQEIIQQNPEEKIEYALIDEQGPDHDKTFLVEVRLNSVCIGKGEGRSKKQAEQIAAKEAIELMGYEV